MAETSATPPTGFGMLREGWRAQAAIVAGFALLLIACGAAITLANRAQTADSWVDHTLAVRENLTRTYALLTDAESAQRSYLLTSDPSYLGPLAAAHQALPEVLATLERLTADNPPQVARQPIIAERMARIDKSVQLAGSGKRDAAIAIVRTGRGQSLMASARQVINAADEEETTLYAQRVRVAASERTNMVFTLVGSTILAALLMVGVGVLGRRYTASLVAANDALKREAAERERAQAHLRQAQKIEAIGRLTGGVAHDFNNMLAIVIGSLDMALSRMAATRAIAGWWRMRSKARERGATLTQRLLAFSRLQPLEPKPTDINKSLHQTSELLFRTLGEIVQIETVLAAGLWPANIDSGAA